jgi:hypothetical protein
MVVGGGVKQQPAADLALPLHAADAAATTAVIRWD